MMRGWMIILITFFCVKGFGQRIAAFRPLRYEEDYSFLAKDTSREWYRSMKLSPLSKNKKTYISTGGEARFQYFYIKNENWGEEPKDGDGYTLTRWLLHTDFHAGDHFRTFVQLQSSLANGRISPGPVEDNPLELHQAFFDINADLSARAKLIFRAGRQELLYGSQRLVAVRDGPNNRHSFDALRTILHSGNYRIDFLYGHYVKAEKGIFNDGFNPGTKLWGVYTVRNKLAMVKNADLYYLGLYKANAVFDDGEGPETRHSTGIRIWNNGGNWRYDIEALYQFGDLGSKRIRAWTASVNSSYSFNEIKFRPEIGLKAELISGDKSKGDGKLQTFNPLFPRGNYFGLAALIGPANLVDIHPSLSIYFNSKMNFDVDYDVFWRYSRYDGIYAVSMMIIYPAQGIFEKHIGRQLAGSLVYRPNDFLYFRTEFTWFDAGSYLQKAGAGKDILFSGITAQIKF